MDELLDMIMKDRKTFITALAIVSAAFVSICVGSDVAFVFTGLGLFLWWKA